MMPILGENRYLVKQGLRLMNTTPRPGIREMAELAKLGIGNLGAEDISWTLAPRLNSSGRLEHAITSYKLLTTDLPEEAHRLALCLEENNAERQKLTTKAFGKARKQILAKGISHLLIASDSEYSGGILGLVAGRLAGEFYRPSVAIKVGDKFSSGSCRSIPEFNMIQAINRCSSLLAHFGGHSQAAGFTLPTMNLGRLEQQLSRIAATELAGLDLQPRLDIDAEIMLDELVGDTFQAIQMLAPFGQGNPLPTLLTRGVKVADCRLMGNNGDHLRLKLRQDSITWDAVAFGLGSLLPKMYPIVDIVYNLELDKWGGQERLRLNILDLTPKS